MKCIPQPCNAEEEFDRGISANDLRFSSDVIDQMKGVNYPDELIRLVESQYLRYGNLIKLQTKSYYSKKNKSTRSFYLGVYEKPNGTQRMAVPPIGDNAPGRFMEQTYRIIDPLDNEKDDFVYYGDVLVLVDESGKVWNCKNKKGSLDGYLSPQERGISGELFISFSKTGKQGEPIVYGEPGVKIQIEESNRFRNSFAGNKLTNFKYSKSKVAGGYIACHGSGHLLNFFIHPESGVPDGSYVKGTTTISLAKSKTSKLMNFLSNDLTEAQTGIPPVKKPNLPKASSLEPIEENMPTDDTSVIFVESIKLVVSYTFILFSVVLLKFNLFNLPLDLEQVVSISNILTTTVIAFTVGLFTPSSLVNDLNFETPKPTIEKQEGEKTVDGFVVIDDNSDTSEETTAPEEEVHEEYDTPIDATSWRAMGKDENGVPLNPQFQRFLDGEFGNMKVAKKRWEVTCNWRESNNIDTILETEYILFEAIKLSYPHYILGKCKKGYLIYIENPGALKLKKLYEAGVCVEDILFHNIYISEFLWKVLEPEGSPHARLLSIIDMSGIRFKDIFGDVISALKSATSISQAHYPERSYKIFVINIPRWFNVIFKIIKPFIAEATLQKVRIYRHGFEKELLEEVDADILPERYGGNNSAEPYHGLLEKKLWSHVYKHCIKGDKKMINKEGKEDPDSINRMKQFIEELKRLESSSTS